MMSTPRKTPRKPALSPQRRASLPAPRKTPIKANSPPEKSNDSAEEGITVAVRMRPLNQNEGNNSRVWKVLPKYRSVTQTTNAGQPLAERVSGRNFFSFDKTFNETVSTTEVYDSVAKDIVTSVVSGLNGTIFAYGQTSSGKTYTMQGSGSIKEGSTPGSGGIIHMAANDIFKNITQAPDRIFMVRASFIEVYNEEVRDLLSHNSPTLQIREDPRRGVFVQSKEEIVTDFNTLLGVLFRGENNRAFASTAMNERSSRSHTIFRVTIESRKKSVPDADGEDSGDEDTKENQVPSDDGAVLVSTLNLVDLAGSESVRHTGATGDRQKEGGMINASLLTLSRVIVALGTPNQTHINFRDSKLTRILQPSLSGNARMAIICCATPSELYLEETRSTLLFASRAKLVKTRAQVNEVMDDRSIIKRLQRELAEAKRNGPGPEQSKHIKALQLKADSAGGAAIAAENRLVRLKKSVLNGGVLFGGKPERPLTLSPLGTSRENRRQIESRKGKRRYSEGGLKTGRLSETPVRSTTKPVPHTAQKADNPEATAALSTSNELQLLREALAAKSNLINELNSELSKSKEFVLTKDTEIAAFNASNLELQGELAKLSASNLELQGELTESKELVLSKDTEISALDEALSDLEKTKANENALSALLEEKKTELQSMEDEVHAKDQKCTDNEAALANALSELERTRSEGIHLAETLKETQLEKEATEQKLQSEKSALQGSLLSLESKHEALETQESEAQQRLQELKTVHDATTAMLTQVQAERDQLVAASTDQELEQGSVLKKLEASQNESARNMEQISRLETQLSECTAENKVLSYQNEERKYENQSLQKDKHSSETALKAALSVKESLELEKAQMQTKLVTTEEHVSSLSGRVEVLSSDLLASTKQLSQLESALVKQTSECKVSMETSDAINEELLGAQTVITNLRATLEAQQSDLSVLASDLEGVLAEVGRHDLAMTPLKSSHDNIAQQAVQLGSAMEDIKLKQKECTQATEETLATIQALELQISGIADYLSRSETHFQNVQAEFALEKNVLESRLSAGDEEKNALTLSLKSTEAKLATIQDHSVASQEEAKCQLATLQGLLDEGAYEKTRLTGELSKLTGDCEASKRNENSLSVSLRDAEARLVLLEEQLEKEALNRDEISLQLASVTKQLAVTSKAQEDAERAAAGFQAKQEGFQSLIDELTNSNMGLESANGKAHSELQLQSDKLRELESLIETNANSLQDSMERTTALKTEKESLEESLKLVIQENAHTSASHGATSQQLKLLQEKISSVNASKEQLETNLQEALIEKSGLESELEACVTEIEEMGARISKLEASALSTDNKLASAEEHAEVVETEKLELQVHIETVGKELEESKATTETLEQALLDSGAQVSQLEDDLALALKEKAEVETRAAALSNDLSGLCQSRDQAVASIALLQEKQETCNTILAELSRAKALIEAQAEEGCKEIQNLSSTIEDLEEALNKQGLMLDNQSQCTESIRQEKKRLEDDLKREETRSQLLEDELAKTKEAIESGFSDFTKLNEELTEAKQESIETCGKLEALGLSHASTLESLERIETEHATLSSELEKVTAENCTLTTAGESSATELSTTLKQLSVVESEKSATLELLHQIEDQKSDLELEVARGKSQLTEMAATVDALKVVVEEGQNLLDNTTKQLDQVTSARSDAVESMEQLDRDKTLLETELANNASKIEKMCKTISELTVVTEAGEVFIKETVEKVGLVQSEKASLEQEVQLYKQRHKEAVSNANDLAAKSGNEAATMKEELETAKLLACKTGEEAAIKIQALTEELENARELAKSGEEANTMVQALKEELETAKGLAAESGGEAGTKIQALTEELKNATELATIYGKQAEVLTQEVKQEQATRAQALSDLQSATSELTKVCQVRDEAVAAIESLRQKQIGLTAAVDDLTCSKVALEAENGSAVAEIQLLSSKISELEASNDINQKSLSAKTLDIAALKTQHEALEMELESARRELNDAAALRDAHETSVQEANSNLLQLQEELNRTTQARGDLDENVNALRSQLVTVERERDNTAAALHSLQLQHQNTATESTNFSAEKEAMSATIQSLQMTIDHGRGQLAASQNKLEVLELDNSTLQGRLNSASQNLASALAEKDSSKDALKKANSKMMGLEAQILHLEANQDNHTNALLQEARSAAIAADDDLSAMEKQLHAVQARLAQCEEELKVAVQDSQLHCTNQETSDSEILAKYNKLESDYSHALKMIDEEKRTRNESEKALLQKSGEEQRMLVREADQRMQELRASMMTLEKKLTESEAEAYAGREANEQYRGHAKRSEKEMQQMKNQVATLETELQELTNTLKDQEKQSNTEITRLVSSVNTCKAELYASKQSIMDLTERLRLSVASEENTTREVRFSQEKALELENQVAELQKKQANLENEFPSSQKLASEIHGLRKELAKKDEQIKKLESIAVAGANPNLVAEIRGLKKEIVNKDGRIKKLESVRLTKEQCRNLKKLKKEHEEYRQAKEALTKENATLRAQGVAGNPGGADQALVENQSLRMSVSALEKKLRKFASHCQSLEDDKERIIDVLSSTFSAKITGGDIPRNISRLCDEHTSLHGKCEALSAQLQGQTSSLARVKELEGVVTSLRKEIGELRHKVSEAEQNKSTNDGEGKNRIAYLEKENLALITDLQEKNQQLQTARKEVSNMRLASLTDSPPTINHASSDGNIKPLSSADMNIYPDTGILSQDSSSPLSLKPATSVQSASWDASEGERKKRSGPNAGEKTPKRSKVDNTKKFVGGSIKKSSTKSKTPSKTPSKENTVPSMATAASQAPGLGEAGPKVADQPGECHQQ